MSLVSENAAVVNGGDTSSTLARAWDLSSPSPRKARSPQTAQASTSARRMVKETAILAPRLMGSRRGVTGKTVAAKINGRADELSLSEAHALDVFIDSILSLKVSP
jgi:hypothetical protein